MSYILSSDYESSSSSPSWGGGGGGLQPIWSIKSIPTLPIFFFLPLPNFSYSYLENFYYTLTIPTIPYS